MKDIAKHGLLVLCLVCLVFAFNLMVVGDNVAPTPEEDCKNAGFYWYALDEGDVESCHMDPKPAPTPDPEPVPIPDPVPAPPSNGADPELEPEPVLGPTCWDESQALYNFSREELKALKEGGFNCTAVGCAMGFAGKDKEKFLEILYNGYAIDIGIPPRIQIGHSAFLSFQISSDYTRKLVSSADAMRLVANLTVARVGEDGKRMLVILDQERRDICLLFTFNPESNRFFLVWNTSGLQPGQYELYIGLVGLCQSCSTLLSTVLFGE